MTPSTLQSHLLALWIRAVAPRFTGTVSEWAEKELRFNEPGRVGNFSFYGREYLREPLNCYGDPSVTDMALCFGTRTGKTTVLYAGAAFSLWRKALRMLFVKPTTKGTAGAEGDAKTRFIPMLRSSPCMASLIPDRRHDFKTAQQILRNGSIADWTGSNSAANVASNSMELVNQDEIDKFNTARRRDENGKIVEADACDLADERTMEFANPKRVKASTPSLVTGRIWTELLKTDLRRRFIPCPLCGRDHPKSRQVVLAWSEQFTVLPKTFADGSPIPLAFVKWDDEAKREDGTWDFERVEKSAGYVCPHCGGRFRDEQKVWADREGEWKATKRGAPRAAGFHLPSMYANHEQTSAGKLAVEFLEALRSPEGPRNMINSRFAEPYMWQGVSINRVGLAAQHLEVTGEWLKILSVDYQQNAPYFWAVVRAWNGSDATHGICYRSFNQWSEVDELQAEHKIIPQAVIIDTGFQQAEVLQECSNLKIASRCALEEGKQGALPEVVGWNPSKAFGGKKLYRDEESGLYLPFRLKRDVDPFAGTELAHTMRIELLEFLNDVFEDILENIRSGKSGLKWTIDPEMDTQEYHRHMAGTKRVYKPGSRDYKWAGVSSEWPDHIRACERMSLVLAYRLRLISFDAIQSGKQETKEEELQAV